MAAETTDFEDYATIKETEKKMKIGIANLHRSTLRTTDAQEHDGLAALQFQFV